MDIPGKKTALAVRAESCRGEAFACKACRSVNLSETNASPPLFSLPWGDQRSKEAACAAPLEMIGAGRNARKQQKEGKFDAGEKYGGPLSFVQAAVGHAPGGRLSPAHRFAIGGRFNQSGTT